MRLDEFKRFTYLLKSTTSGVQRLVALMRSGKSMPPNWLGSQVNW